MVGQKFGKLTVIERSPNKGSNGAIRWICECDCGEKCEAVGSDLRNGRKTHCGCSRKTNKIDLTNQRFGKLVAICPTERRVNGKVIWKCVCDCGSIHYVHSGNLTSGAVRSCGCINSPLKGIDLAGQKFGLLTVIGKQDEYQQQCLCECGNIINIPTYELIHKGRKVCGECNIHNTVGQKFGNWTVIDCTKEKTKDGYYLYTCQCDCGNIEKKTISTLRSQKGEFCNVCRIHDLTGQVFTYLTVISKSDYQNEKRGAWWNCQCQCGNIIKVYGGNLVSGNTKSCGCIRESSGELKIRTLLEEHNILFETQKTFDSCRFADTQALARFDFYLPDYNIIIEYDGQQHYKERQGWEDLSKIQQRDLYKNEWCKENNITLIRIPYTDFSKIEINDLLLESEYIL